MKFAFFGAILILLVFVIIHETSKETYSLTPISLKSNWSSNERNTVKDDENLNVNKIKAQIFWNNLFETISKNSLDLTKDEINNAITYTRDSERKETYTRDVLLSKATISDKAYNEFKTKHKRLLQEIPSEIPTTAYKPGSNGIVFVGGGRYSWLSYLSLLGLRETGSKLPVEIIMPKYVDYEEEIEFCNEILPKLNAKCVIIPDIFGPSVMAKWNNKIKSYQFKSLALMVSSFQNVLLLDSDNIVIENPDPFFNSDLFHKYGMITWPDYWRRTISPHFYDIAGVSVNEKKRVRYDRLPIGYDKSGNNLEENGQDSVPFHDLDGTVPNLSTESGQLFINKVSHGKTLLLSLYYNLYGPELYYKLFSLGELGEGDKDTFAAAATVLKQNFYQLKSSIKGIGHYEKDDHFQGKAMAQKNPLKDYDILNEKVLIPLIQQENNKMPLNEREQYAKNVIKNHFTSNNDNPIFAMHCHYPKLDPADIMQRSSIYDKEEKRLHYRMYKGFSFERNLSKNNITIDFELTQWTNMQKTLCIEKLYFRHFGHDTQELCEFINNQVKWLSNP